jgi:NTE family protein
MEISNQNNELRPILPPTSSQAPTSARSRKSRKRISLALQGGGSFGAFTWGVLDRLLEENDLSFDAISGASAGAINAGVMAAGSSRAVVPRQGRALSDFGPA